MPSHIEGSTRNSIIRQYQQWKGEYYIPYQVDTALHWSSNDPLEMPVVTDSKWQIIDKSRKKSSSQLPPPITAYIPAKGTKTLNLKRKSNETKPVLSKRIQNTSHEIDNSPTGYIWDNQNYSCPYDSLFTILYNLWLENSIKWTEIFTGINHYTETLANGFTQVQEETLSLEEARNIVRDLLHQDHSIMFPKGKNSASVGELATILLKDERFNGRSEIYCENCDYIKSDYADNVGYCFDLTLQAITSTSQWTLSPTLTEHDQCPECLETLVHSIKFDELPKLLILEYPFTNIRTSHKIKVKAENNSGILGLRGTVYHGDNHFTSRFISSNGTIWYHDGITTGRQCTEERNLCMTNSEYFIRCKEKDFVFAVYA